MFTQDYCSILNNVYNTACSPHFCHKNSIHSVRSLRRSKIKENKTLTNIVPHLFAVCFPQFGPRGQLPQHGFVRKSNDWTAVEPKEGDKRMVFKHTDTEETRASAWPHKFEATYEVELGSETLTTCLRVKNTGDEPFDFTCALHTYFRVSDITKIAIKGLKVCVRLCVCVHAYVCCMSLSDVTKIDVDLRP
jgi:hypothetical protein